MRSVTHDTSLEELAALVSRALEAAGIMATLSGGAAVSLYSANEYESCDLDFVTSERTSAIAVAIAPLGFRRVPGARQFEHPATAYYVEFPPGPLGFGETSVRDDEAATLQTGFGPLRIVTPTQCVMDRLAAYVSWADNPSFDQAIMVARRHPIDWSALCEWARLERIDSAVIDRLKKRVVGT
ncbi:MAG TPA: hypothetical protein VIL17_04140 [Coriobacteriia bacterium]